MRGLIEALIIFLKYRNEQWPTHCEHDTFCIMGITKGEISEEDRKRLDKLGFIYGSDSGGEGCWLSYRYGSA